jgi:hypothetical protein
MMNPAPLQHDRAAGQVHPLGPQLAAQAMVAAAIAEPQAWDTAPQFAQAGEMGAERTAAIEHQQGRGQRSRGRRMEPHGINTMQQETPAWRSPTAGRGRALAQALLVLVGRRPWRAGGSEPWLARLIRPLSRVFRPLVGPIRPLAGAIPAVALALLLASFGVAPPPAAAAQAAESSPGGLFVSGQPLRGPAANAAPLGTSSRYRCDGDLLIAQAENGAVDALAIPNTSAGTLPGAFIVLQWRGTSLQLPRTNNAGPPSYTDGLWWWSLEDPEHPNFRLRRGGLQVFACAKESNAGEQLLTSTAAKPGNGSP